MRRIVPSSAFRSFSDPDEHGAAIRGLGCVAEHGLLFPPELPTSNRATIGAAKAHTAQ